MHTVIMEIYFSPFYFMMVGDANYWHLKALKFGGQVGINIKKTGMIKQNFKFQI